jgi:exopolysaccharide biosynthesis polyprenyl glycosylphosphotransferase
MFKRIEDIVLSLLLLTLLSWVVCITALLIKIESKGPVLFSQSRLGKRKKEYQIYKFRSMRVDAEKDSGPVWAKTNDDRITRVGKFIRKWRVDEIPQLWNVLKGDMSLVGPRPEREYFINQLEGIIPYYSQRFTVKPGLTGWAQVCYGYGDSVEDAIEKLNYDLFYIKNMSFFMDVVIIFRTVKTVIFGVGAR